MSEPQKTPEEIKEEKKNALMQFMEKTTLDIESLNQNINILKGQISEIPNLVQQVVISTIQQISQAQQSPQIDMSSTQPPLHQMGGMASKIPPEALQTVIEKLLTKLFPEPTPDNNLLGIDSNWIKEEVVNAFKEDLTLGKEIRQSIKRALISKQGRSTMLKTIEGHGIE